MLQAMKGGGALLCGPLARDPEFTTVGVKGVPICRFTVCTERGTPGERNGEFARCTAWFELREALRGAKKGDAVFVLAKRKENTGKDGKVYVDYQVEFATVAARSSDKPEAVAKAEELFGAQVKVVENDDDLPF